MKFEKQGRKKLYIVLSNGNQNLGTIEIKRQAALFIPSGLFSLSQNDLFIILNFMETVKK